MSSGQYPWWFRLYPKQFVERYGEEMYQVIQDRQRDERGPISSTMIWVDLVKDLAVSLPLVHQTRLSKRDHLPECGDHVLKFDLIEERNPSYLVIAISTLLSLLLLHFIRTLHACPEYLIPQSSGALLPTSHKINHALGLFLHFR